MSSQIINIALNEDIIKYTANHIKSLSKTNDFSDIVIIMPSKRPALFIKKELSKNINKSFIPPSFLTFDEIVNDITTNYYNLQKISEIDSAYIIYDIVKKNVPELFEEQNSFASFFQWSYEILFFIDALDIEKIPDEKLLNIKLNADIGYDLPSNINELLKHLYLIKQEFHKQLNLLKKTTRGYSYYNADSKISQCLQKYKNVILFNPYYLNKSETDMFKKIYDENKLDIILKGNKNNWNSLDKIYKDFSCFAKNDIKEKVNSNINFYSAYDGESQACLAKNLISKLPSEDISETVVIVPDNSILPSVMNQMYSIIDEVNVAVGYPATKTTVFALINALLKVQKTKKNNKYYVKDILSVLSNPLVKNMRFIGNPSVTRIIVHKLIEHFDRFNKEAEFSGYLFIQLDEIKNNTNLQNEISRTISAYWQRVTPERVKELFDEIFNLFFDSLSNVASMYDLSNYIKKIADSIVEKSLINTYPFNLSAINILYDIAGQFQKAICTNENFSQHEILYILEKILLKGNVSLIGSPLKGLQILGSLEARGLSFKNVYVLSMSDSIMPSIKEASPLIPKDIMSSLGIGYVSREVDIQKYHFMSLISSSQNVSLIYPDDEKNERSRFIEELIWDKQLKEKSLEVAKIIKTVLPSKTLSKNKQEFAKTDKIKVFLKEFSYSPTSIDIYLKCKLQFYYKYILKLSQQTDFEQNYESQDIGNFIHEFLEKTLCKGFVKEDLLKDSTYVKYNNILNKHLDECFKKHETGKIFLLKKLIKKRMCDFYENEKIRDFKEILETEFPIVTTIRIGDESYNLKVKVDRIDKNISDNIYIIDYKTGSIVSPVTTKVSGEIKGDRREFIQQNIKSFQLPIYKYVYESKFSHNIDNCMLYSLRDGTKIYLFKEKLSQEDKINIYNTCIEQLKYIISEINSDEPFKSEIYDEPNCTNCPYFYLCR
ncbi:MAG: PD-(D/E)XK nuclease family protein [Endomicrobiaceae bacterium]|nr:PD-(D/E)XK nuclease family protein [Endomicrobiaceae bacterium]